PAASAAAAAAGPARPAGGASRARGYSSLCSLATDETEVDVQAEEHAAADHQEQAGKHGGGGDAGDLRRDLLSLAPQELGVVPADVVADGHQGVGERRSELLGLLQRGDEPAQRLVAVPPAQCLEGVLAGGAQVHLA